MRSLCHADRGKDALAVQNRWKQRSFGVLGQLKPLSCCRNCPVFLLMWITQKEKEIMIFRDLALQVGYYVFPEPVTWHMIELCLFVSYYWKHRCRFYLRLHKISFPPPTSLPACHSILWFTAVIVLSPFVRSPAVVYESCPCLLSTSCTLLITPASVSLCGKPSMLAGFSWEITVT